MIDICILYLCSVLRVVEEVVGRPEKEPCQMLAPRTAYRPPVTDGRRESRPSLEQVQKFEVDTPTGSMYFHRMLAVLWLIDGAIIHRIATAARELSTVLRAFMHMAIPRMTRVVCRWSRQLALALSRRIGLMKGEILSLSGKV
jgi:hypothetical protein